MAKRTRHRSTFKKGLFEWIQIVVFSAINVYVLFRLGNMQLEGLPAFAGVSIALMIAFTSLMFNRARAYPEGPTQRRSLLAAEKGLEAVLMAILSFMFIAVVFSQLQFSEKYPPTPMYKGPPFNLPAYCAFFSSVMLMFTTMKFFEATGYVLSKSFRIRSLRGQVKSMKRAR